MAAQSFLGDPHAQLLTYSDFQSLLQSGKIKEVTISEDRLTGTLRPSISVPQTPAPFQQLRRASNGNIDRGAAGALTSQTELI
jgi:hypothetical protein